jgi:hypothetical protein
MPADERLWQHVLLVTLPAGEDRSHRVPVIPVEKVVDGSGRPVVVESPAMTGFPVAVIEDHEFGRLTLMQAAWASLHKWIEDADRLQRSCAQEGCVHRDHIELAPEKEGGADKDALARLEDERLLALVERSGPTLAELFQRGRRTGLLSSRSAYG